MEDRYKVLVQVNKGAFACVYKAVDTVNSNNMVALKKIHSAKYNPTTCQREARIHAMFSGHPHVATLYAAGKYGHTYAMAMELGEKDLLEIIKPDLGLGEERAMLYTMQVMTALESMHARGYVHRDIKPENIALMRDGNVCLIDFGHASLASDVGPKNARIGTAQYLAPEGTTKKPIDPTKMDVFSSGVCLFAIATGRFPWLNASLRDQEYKAWMQGGVGPKNKSYWLSLSPFMMTLLRNMLEADPTRRWSAAKVRGSIAAHLETLRNDDANSIVMDKSGPANVAKAKEISSSHCLRMYKSSDVMQKKSSMVCF